MKDFWFISLVALVVIGFAVGWNIPVRVAVVANAVVVLIGVIRQMKGWRDGRKTEN